MSQPNKVVESGRRPQGGLLWQLFLVTILPLAALTVVIAFGSLTMHQHAMRDLVAERDERAVRTAAVALEEQLNHRKEAMRSVALLAKGRDRQDLAHVLSSSDYLLSEFDSGMAFFDPNGELVSSNGDEALWRALQAAGQAPIEGSANPPLEEAIIRSGFRHPVTRDWMVVIFAATPSGEWIAAGASTASSLVEHTLTATFASGSTASVVVVDESGNVLYQLGDFSYAQGVAAHPGVSEALRGERGIAYVPVGASEHVVTYSPIASTGWALAMQEPWETVDTSTLRTTQLAPLVLVPVLLLTILALGFGVRWVVKPLQALETRASKLAWGDFAAIEDEVGGIAEIHRLQVELIHMARKLKAAQVSLHSYIGAITAGQEEERRRLARELHDDTIQSLIALKQRVQLAQLANDNQATYDSLDEVVGLTEQAIENVRRQTRALRPIYLEDLGLATALEMLARETAQTAAIPVGFHREGAETRLNAEVELALYRMAQEALNNVSRHAQATQAELLVSYSSEAITLVVRDNGLGFEVPISPAEFAPAGHFGLLGLHERAELIGARLDIKSCSGEGTEVIVRLPRNGPNANPPPRSAHFDPG